MTSNNDRKDTYTPPVHDHISSCPFCTIIGAYPPVNPLDPNHSNTSESWDPEKLNPPAFVALATDHIVAFLDIAPLTRGHVLVSPRRHRVKIGDLTADEMGEVGRVLPLLARAVVKAVLPDIPHAEADYNVVQNNGPGAAQVIPHVHFHIIPRPPLNYRPPAPESTNEKSPSSLKQVPTNSSTSSGSKRRSASRSRSQSPAKPNKYPPAKIPTGLQKSYIQFGRGMRNELDEDDAATLVEEIRRCIREELLKDSAVSGGLLANANSGRELSRGRYSGKL